MILVDGITDYNAELTANLPSSHWAHMVSDASEDELHRFAARLGLKRSWAQLRPSASAAHYDLTPRRRALAVRLGAIEVTSRELVVRNFDGLRRRGLLGPTRATQASLGLGDPTRATQASFDLGDPDA